MENYDFRRVWFGRSSQTKPSNESEINAVCVLNNNLIQEMQQEMLENSIDLLKS